MPRAEALAPLLFALSAVLSSAPGQVPGLDDCPGFPVTDGATNSDNFGSTPSATGPFTCNPDAGTTDVWFTYTATCTGNLQAGVVASFGIFALEVYDASCGACGAQPGWCLSFASFAFLPVVQGGTYDIRVGGRNGGQGQFTLMLTCVPAAAPDDEAIGAAPIGLGTNGPFPLAGYTASAPFWSCVPVFPPTADRWFRFVPTCSAPHTFQTCGPSSMDTELQVFLAGAIGAPQCQAPTEIGCTASSTLATCGVNARLTVDLAAGTPYWVRVGSYLSGGSFSLTASIGTDSGSSRRRVPTACGNGASLAVGGNLNIGGTVQLTLTGYTGLPLVMYGFTPDLAIPAPCSCVVLGDGAGGLGTLLFGGAATLPLPCDPNLIGLQAEVQGIDLAPMSGGCVFLGIPFAATDIFKVTIG